MTRTCRTVNAMTEEQLKQEWQAFYILWRVYFRAGLESAGLMLELCELQYELLKKNDSRFKAHLTAMKWFIAANDLLTEEAEQWQPGGAV